MIEALFLTVILECIALFVLGERDRLFYLYWMAVTSFTNLSINLYISLVFSGNLTEYYITVAILEALVLVSEFLFCLLYTRNAGKSMKYSVVCNFASFLLGLIILSIL